MFEIITVLNVLQESQWFMKLFFRISFQKLFEIIIALNALQESQWFVKFVTVVLPC